VAPFQGAISLYDRTDITNLMETGFESGGTWIVATSSA
jgi:hypothetical protein